MRSLVAYAQASPEWPTLTNAIVPAALAGALVIAESAAAKRQFRPALGTMGSTALPPRRRRT